MNVKEINKYFMNCYYKKDSKIYYEILDDIIYVSDSYSIFILNKEDFILDVNRDKFISVKLNHFFNCMIDYQDANVSNNFIKSGNINMIKIESLESGKYCFINNIYLKLFNNCKVKIKDNTSPVLFYLNDEIVGLVLPIRAF